MAEIKFKKTTDLPSSPTSADDGVYFVVDKDGVFSKIAVISGGVIKEYTSEGGGTPTLSEVLTEGNLIDDFFGTVIEFENPYGENYFIFNEDGNLTFSNGDDGLSLNDDGSIRLHSTVNLKLNNQTFPLTAGTNGQVLTTDGNNMSWTTPSSGTTYSEGVGINIITALPNDTINLKPATSSELGGVKVWSGLQEDYDLIAVKDPDTLYYIIDKTPDLIYTVEILTAITLSTSGGFVPDLSIAIFPSIWNKTYDWDIVWRDSNGLHNLRDFFGDVIFKITHVTYNGSGLSFQWVRNDKTTSNVTIPAGAKLVLRLSDNAPTYST